MEDRMKRLNVMQHNFNKKLPYVYRKFTHFQEDLLFFGASGFKKMTRS
jgi:hypothetical protein